MYNLDMTIVKKNLEQFTCMNDFFVRELTAVARPIAGIGPAGAEDASIVASAADCRLMCFPSWSDATRVWVKGKEFSVPKFLGNDELAAEMEGGSMTIFRLAPQDYHRYHCPVSGELDSIPQIYHFGKPCC
jgi:phosphatidylserine decarboxylase